MDRGADATQTLPCLEIQRGPESGRVFRLYEGTTIIGRTSLHADVAIDANGVSRRHAKLVVDEHDVATLSDLGSTNGTMVDGNKVATVGLDEGACIQLGPEVQIRFRRLPLAEIRARERDAQP